MDVGHAMEVGENDYDQSDLLCGMIRPTLKMMIEVMEDAALLKMKDEVRTEEEVAEEEMAEKRAQEDGFGNAADDTGRMEIGNGKSAAKRRKAGWLWPLGVLAGGVGLVVLRGCWHRRLSWPVRAQGHSYQVCLGCGAKKLFDEQGFRAYGPFRYDLNELIAWDTERQDDADSSQSKKRRA
jgi:hypothetical protein